MGNFIEFLKIIVFGEPYGSHPMRTARERQLPGICMRS